MLIGLDFDNTLVCCDALFYREAVERKLISPEVRAVKDDIRDHLRAQGREDAWTELQGYVYGLLLPEAPPFPGMLEFFARCHRLSVPLCIVSHKTRHPFMGQRFDLHRAAHAWLEQQGFYNPGPIALSPSRVFFEETKSGKLARIAQTECTHFVDDLPEFLVDPAFPPGVERILFDPNARHPDSDAFQRLTSWDEITAWVTGKGLPIET